MSGLRPELHVAQQIRRDKLRIQNSSQQHLQDFPNNITEQVSLHQGPGFRSDLLHVRNVRNGNNMLDDDDDDDDDDKAALYSSEMMISNFSTPSNPLPTAPRNPLECQELGEPSSSSSRLMMPHYGSLFPQYSSASTIHSSPKEQCQPRTTNNLGTWRNNTTAPHHQFSDWMLNYPTTTSVANQTNPNSFLASELISINHYNNVKPSCNLLTDLQSSPSSTSGGEMATREIQKQLGEMHNTMHYPPSSSAPLYHNALLQDIFKSTSSTGAHVSEMASLMHHGIWGGNNSVPVFHGNQPNVSNPHHQGLSLSLSSNSQSEPPSASHFEERSVNVKPSIVSTDCGKQLHQDSMGIATTPPSNAGYRNVGPLGPFTGYATILKSSRFLKPCQQLLDECCCCQKAPAEWVSRDHNVSSSTSAHDGAVINVEELSGVSAKGGGASSPMLYASKENSSSADGGAATSFCLSSRPECQKNKAKLLYMQEEVARRYKQYHQQMQMVVSSFESVAGLSSATPYISLALKSVSRHFRCLKNAISDQLKLTYEVLGEDFSIPSTSTSCKIDNNIARLRSMDHSFQKNKSGGSNIDFLEPQLQQVWRPQRGLPERSVAILKAWLFEHFLHPYPTDTDKHMLATQTGLSRNQVSNWFINARVRVWKPMVEEIHMLETKGTTETHQNNSKNEGASSSECSKHARSVDQHVNMFSTHGIAGRQFQCLEMGSTSGGNEEKGTNHEEQWNQEKRSKLECEITPNMDGTVMGFMPYRRGSGLEVGIGSVSLTLGLRHGVEGVQQHQQQQLQHQEELRRHYGGHMIHDFVG